MMRLACVWSCRWVCLTDHFGDIFDARTDITLYSKTQVVVWCHLFVGLLSLVSVIAVTTSYGLNVIIVQFCICWFWIGCAWRFWTVWACGSVPDVFMVQAGCYNFNPDRAEKCDIMGNFAIVHSGSQVHFALVDINFHFANRVHGDFIYSWRWKLEPWEVMGVERWWMHLVWVKSRYFGSLDTSI